MSNNAIEQLWNDFKKQNPNAPETYEAWAFGNSKQMADELADLVVRGIKTATASNYLAYEEKEPLPDVGLHNIILDGEGKPVAIVKTTVVEIIPYDEVTEEHAYLEGEGDRTLAYWKAVHEPFFTNELNQINQSFHHKIPVVCEQFELVYIK
ncbi:hypothetical protein Pryu01_00263 [Paraliobacillus ryukyuensis]|uniref:Uncharacterized protein YhfF n=1 Tax=Paraliobacillus ryukyuensis TaxID=200904 RepID=A0A366EJR3_9BACI|nr:ASCH domain-containing protein [Paraliobacillus ryukyuensis]RBP01665.1 uncharacterized protein YhfF [Paraliobacillus ryukyuensis]